MTQEAAVHTALGSGDLPHLLGDSLRGAHRALVVSFSNQFLPASIRNATVAFLTQAKNLVYYRFYDNVILSHFERKRHFITAGQLMSILEIDSVTATADGIEVHGTYDPHGEKVLGLRVKYKLSQQNRGEVRDAYRGPNRVVRITSNVHSLRSGDRVTVDGVEGTTEANGDWWIHAVSDSMFDLRDCVFENPYKTSKGIWFLTGKVETSADVDGDPPPTSWTSSIILTRPGIYDVRAVLSWTGSPNSISTPSQSIAFP